MSRLMLDQFAASLANQARARMEVCDPTGRVLGHFIPLVTAEDYASIDIQISEEELDRRERIEGGRSLKDILADLEKRG